MFCSEMILTIPALEYIWYLIAFLVFQKIVSLQFLKNSFLSNIFFEMNFIHTVQLTPWRKKILLRILI